MEATPQHIALIHRFLDALGRQERKVLGVRVSLWVISIALCAALGAAAGFSFGVSRLGVGGVVAVLGLAALVRLFVWTLRPQWRRAGVMRWQARRVEARLPGLRSRMITVVDRSVDVAAGQPAFSTALWSRAAAHAQAATTLIDLSDVHPWARIRRAFLAAVSLLLACMLAGSILPVGPLDALDVLMGKSAAAVRLEAATAASSEERALVGDITLRYIYPDYMGMDPVEVPNSDGTIHAPPGTRVQITARTAERFDAAAIQVDQADPLDAGLTDGRDLSADITVQMDGAWRFILFSGEEVQASPDYKVIVEADQPPVVVASVAGETSVAVDAPLGIGWQVTDDYGIASVTMEWTKDGELKTAELRAPIDPVAELSGRIRKTPRALGLRPGDTVKLRIAAIDSDKSSGGNRGESEEIVLQILGPRGVGRRLTEYHRKLRDALLGALADFLEEPVPPAENASGMLRWARKTRARLDPVREVYQDQWGDEQSQAVDGQVVREVMEASGRLYRFTIVTFDTGDVQASSGRKAKAQDYTTFVTLHGETVVALERAVWLIDEMLRQVAVAQLARMAGDVAEQAAQLKDLADSGADADALLARLDRLERLMSKMTEAAQQLSQGHLKEFLNSQMDEARGRADAIRQAIAEGRMEDAQRMLEEMAEQLERFAEGLKEQMTSSQQGDDELAKRLKQLMEDLGALSEEQESLADKLAEARQQHGGDLDQVMAQWERLDILAKEAVGHTEVILSKIGDGAGWTPRVIRRAEIVGQEVRGTQDAIRARDAQGALERVYGAERYQSIVSRDLKREVDSGTVGATEAESSGRALGVALREMASILEQMRQSPQESSPELQQAAQELSAQQTALRERQQQLAQEVQTVERAIPTGDGSAQENMKGAGSAMDNASDALNRGEAMQGEGHQREAQRKLEQTKESLQQAAQRQQQMQQQMQRMAGEGEGGGHQPSGEQDNPAMSQPEIPTPEAFKTPEAYRRALLEGMAEDVPEEFKALKKRFYEELVRQ